MTESATGVRASVGFASKTGPRADNDDFAGAVFGWELPQPRQDVIAAIADGIGGNRGGRAAAETAVRGFLDGFCDLPETMEVQRAAARIANALNAWIHSQGRQDPGLQGMGCTFTALVLRGRHAHILHVGDTRAYRLHGERLVCLTSDHVRQDAAGQPTTLYRAMGVEAELRLDYHTQPVALHDRFLLCSDGVHRYLTAQTIGDLLRERSAPQDAARALIETALDSGSTDNCTALVVDVTRLPTANSEDVGSAVAKLPMIAAPIAGDAIDGFLLKALVSEGRFSRIFAAIDEIDGGDAALKFPKPKSAADEVLRRSFAREAWVGAHIRSPWLVRILELPPGRQSCLYAVMPLYSGELLETRITRAPLLGLEEGRNIAIRLARAVAALHNAGIIHRDIKPDNVILEPGGDLKLVDLGVVRIPGWEDLAPEDVPGTPGYVAPEMSEGEAGNEMTDVFALGVTMFRAFTGEFPYGDLESGFAARLRPKELLLLRPDLPAWLQATLARSIALDPAERFRNMTEFAVEMEAGPAGTSIHRRRPPTLYERAPLRVWQGIAGLLALALLWSLLR